MSQEVNKVFELKTTITFDLDVRLRPTSTQNDQLNEPYLKIKNSFGPIHQKWWTKPHILMDRSRVIKLEILLRFENFKGQD